MIIDFCPVQRSGHRWRQLMNINKNEFKNNLNSEITDVKETERNKKYRVKITNKRQLKFFQWFVFSNVEITNKYLSSPLKNKQRIDSINRLSTREASDIIHEVIYYYHDDNNDTIAYYCREIDELLDCMLPDSEFDWFKENKDACYFVWLYIKNKFPGISESLFRYHTDNTPYKFPNTPPATVPSFAFIKNTPVQFSPKTILSELASEPGYDQKQWYSLQNFLNEISSLVQYPANHRERFQSIIHYIDRVPATRQTRFLYVKTIRNEWHLKNWYKNIINISSSDEALCEWAWQYMRNKSYPRKRVYTEIIETTEITGNVEIDKDSVQDSEDNKNTHCPTQGVIPPKKWYFVKEYGPGQNNTPGFPQIEWQRGFSLIQPQTPAEMHLAVNAIWTFYIRNNPCEIELLPQFRRSRDTYLTRRNKNKKANSKKK